MLKNELRKKYRELKKQLSEEEVLVRSLAVANKLLQLPLWEKTYFHVFLPITEHKEVNTEFILHLLSGKDKEIVVSKSDFNTLTLTHFLLTDNTLIRKNNYNIPEPVDGIEVPPNKIEVVFVPLLAFDKTGHRVGFGKGFYDKFLSACKPDTIKVGLSLFDAEDKITDIFEGDVKLDYCVTPDRVYSF